MCGIFAYLGSKEASKECLNGLKKLEYRGYDSAGLATLHSQEIHVCKHVGKVHALEKALDRHPLQGLLAIAHTRWATHGIPSQDNAHPHLDQNKTVAVVHNGIIENYHQLKQTLIKDKGISFSSDTDTEVIAQLIPLYYEGNFLEACLKSLPSLEGSFALAILHKDHPDELIATAEKNPLIVGWDEASKDCYVTSDVNALSSPHVKLYFLAQVPQYLS